MDPAPAPEAPPEAEAVPEPEVTLSSVLAGLTPEEPSETPTEAPTEPAEAPAEPEAPPAPGKLEDLFTDAALATPEGVKRAAAEVRALRAKHESAWLRVNEREAKFKRSLDAFKQEKAEVQTLATSVRSSLQALRRGTTEQRLDALGHLTGQDGIKVFEELTIDLARGGKKSNVAPEVAELRNEIAELKGYLARGKADEEVRSRESFISRRKAEIAQAAGDAKAYPHLARLAPSKGREIADHVAELMTEAHQAGTPISDTEALSRLEREVAQAVQPLGAGPDLAIGATPQGGQKPEKARSTPGRSLSPSLATKVGSVREITDAERLEELGKDTDYLRSLGLPV